jgi:NAD-dependent deacetylase
MFEKIAQLIKTSNHVVVFTGAGMSTESGIPDFRGAKGIWKDKNPAKLASTFALRWNKKEFYAFYKARIENLLSVSPHKGHRLLSEWEDKGIIKQIITQNVDGFHQQAGSKQVAELHGTIATLRCLKCKKEYEASYYLQENGNKCSCSGFIRPNVVLFGESLPKNAVEQAEEQTLLADCFIVLGSSLQVSPANRFPKEAKQNGAQLILINQDSTIMDHYFDHVINDVSIGEALTIIDSYLKKAFMM